MAILEFTSSNGYSFFTINFECRDISIIDTEYAIFSHFSYAVRISNFFMRLLTDLLVYRQQLIVKKMAMKNGIQIQSLLISLQSIVTVSQVFKARSVLSRNFYQFKCSLDQRLQDDSNSFIRTNTHEKII